MCLFPADLDPGLKRPVFENRIRYGEAARVLFGMPNSGLPTVIFLYIITEYANAQ
jgi:hypothetical protein